MTTNELPFSDGDLVKSVGSTLWHGARHGRMKEAHDRLLMYRGQHRPLIVTALSEQQHDKEVFDRMCRHVQPFPNLARDITTQVAACYKQGVLRTLRPKVKPKPPEPGKLPKLRTNKEQDAFDDLNEETGIDMLAPEINRLAYYVGPVLEMPCVRNGKACRDIYTADEYEVALDPADPLGPPVKAAYPWYDGTRDPRTGNPFGNVVILTDDVAHRYFRSGEIEPYRTIKHGVARDGEPVFPGTIWRLGKPTSPWDWWLSDENDELHSASMACCLISTRMDFVRKSQDKNIAAYFGNLDKLPKGQILDPERMFHQDVREGDDQPTLQVSNFNTPPEGFVSQIRFIAHTQLRARGIPESAYDINGDGNGSSSGITMAIQHEQLSALRNAQKPFLRNAERESAWKLVAAVKAAEDYDDAGLPDPEDVRDRFILVIPELNRVDDPEKLRAHLDWERSRGYRTDLDDVLMMHPDLSAKQGMDFLAAKLEMQAAINDFKASRNQGGKVTTAAEANGKMGGDIAAGNEPSVDAPPDGAEDESETDERREPGAG